MAKVALIKGDGTGPELVDSMVSVLNRVGTNVELISCEAGSEWWEKAGGPSYIPDETWNILSSSDACFKGPTTTVPVPGTPRSVAVTLRQKFELYSNVRPIKSYSGQSGPLGDVDFVCVREATEGLYSGIEFKIDNDTAIAMRKISRKGSERIAEQAFKLCNDRNWDTIIAITKRNILKETDSLFLDSVNKIGEQFPNIKVEEYFVDNITQQLVKNPTRFNKNILLSTNLFMDIVSEEASGLIGSIGCVYSGNFGDKYAMFEPAHGSAPKYKGQNKTNPTATILSGAWMLRYLGETDLADAIFQATEDVISEGKYLTYDLGGDATTTMMSDAIGSRAEQILSK